MSDYDWRAEIRERHGWADDTTDEYLVKHDRLAAVFERLEAENTTLIAERWWLAKHEQLDRMVTYTDEYAGRRLLAAQEAVRHE